MKPARLRAWFTVGVLGMAGCVGSPHLPADVHFASGFAAEGTEYGDALAKYTRKAELYDGFDTVAKAWLTWRAPRLQRALAEATGRAYGLDSGQTEALREEMARKARGVRQFHLALYTPKSDWNDLESADTLWKAFLILPGGDRLEPIRVQYLPKTDKSTVVYPYVSLWTREYELDFPLPGEKETQEHLDVEITGPLGAMRFSF